MHQKSNSSARRVWSSMSGRTVGVSMATSALPITGGSPLGQERHALARLRAQPNIPEAENHIGSITIERIEAMIG